MYVKYIAHTYIQGRGKIFYGGGAEHKFWPMKKNFETALAKTP